MNILITGGGTGIGLACARELGALTGFATYDNDGQLRSLLPANFVAGTARLNGRKVVIGADDFSVRAGSGDAAIHAKQIFAEHYAGQMRLPVVRLLWWSVPSTMGLEPYVEVKLKPGEEKRWSHTLDYYGPGDGK